MSTNRVRRAVVAGIATIGAFGVASSGVGSAESAAADTSTLRELCESKGGDFYVTPMALGRCQEARGRKGFSAERAECEDVLGGRFSAVESFSRRNRWTWVCLVS